MLCQNCEKAIQVAAKNCGRAQGMSDMTLEDRLSSSFLHFSLRDFSRSIAEGCYVCRNLEKSFCPEARLRTEDELGGLNFRPPRLVNQILTRVVNWTIQPILIPCTIYTRSNLSKRLLNEAQQWCTKSYLFWIYINPTRPVKIEVLPIGFKHIKPNSLPPLLGPGPHPGCTGESFDLWPILSHSASVNPHSDARLGTRSAWTGDSTALWHYWFNTCLENHATCRSVEQSLQNYSPKRLVELILDDNSCLSMWRLVYSATIGTVPYFTLSHCWGSSQPVHLTKNNISSFSNSSSVCGLPETYRHALEIVNSLGYKYIWIDSLCIVQDDTKDWEAESSLMGLTYNHAVCNIAATWAADGGDGCFSTRDPTTVCPTFITPGFELNGSSIFQISMARDFAYNKDITQASLNQRGWVVQERYLARRQLSCAKRQIYWECHELLASEEFPYGHPADDPEHPLPRYGAKGSPQKPCLDSNGGPHTRQRWADLVELYSGCQLTRETDKLVALSGLANKLEAMVDDVYIFGLWTKGLCQQLWWQPDVRSHDQRTTTRVHIAPTWSWANFDGPIIFDEAYYHDTWHEYKYWTEVAETPTDSTKSLTLRGLALKSGILCEDEGDLREKRDCDAHLSFDRRRTPYIPSSSSTRVMIIWDEHISQDANPEEWSNLQKQRNSDLLFLVIRSWKMMDEAKGLVLWMLPHVPDDPVLCSRVGTFTAHDIEHHALTHMMPFLELHEGDTEDIMAAELIQTVTII